MPEQAYIPESTQPPDQRPAVPQGIPLAHPKQSGQLMKVMKFMLKPRGPKAKALRGPISRKPGTVKITTKKKARYY